MQLTNGKNADAVFAFTSIPVPGMLRYRTDKTDAGSPMLTASALMPISIYYCQSPPLLSFLMLIYAHFPSYFVLFSVLSDIIFFIAFLLFIAFLNNKSFLCHFLFFYIFTYLTSFFMHRMFLCHLSLNFFLHF
jgi:hypothetical protein